MNSINISEISRSPLILEFTKEVFEGFYNINLNVPKKQVIDTQFVSRVSPKSFQKSMMQNPTSTTEPVAGQNVYYVEGKPRVINGMIKIQNLLNDPSVASIECQGPNAALVVIRRGARQFTRILLSQAEITDILEDFTDRAHIPLVDGVVHVAVNNLEVRGVYSDLVRSNFIITRI